MYSNWSEVNELVNSLYNSSCPAKTIKKWFPHCKIQSQQSSRQKQVTNKSKILNKKLRRNESCESSFSAYGKMQNAARKASLFDYETLDSQEHGECLLPASNSNEETMIPMNNNTPDKPRGQQKALLFQIEASLPCESRYDSIFDTVDEVQLDSCEKSENLEIKTTKSGLSVQEMTTIRKKFRNRSKERYKAECIERLSILRIQTAKQRYALHLAEMKKRDTNLERLTSFRQKKCGAKGNVMSSQYIMKMRLKAMETGMLLTC
mmetsp:Transcript_17207/g.19910  ORF Transcript_17207/g.19910 Transcript_17207/m.19910 type:complete len:263 (+) Transcript_17207:171-959(+)